MVYNIVRLDGKYNGLHSTFISMQDSREKSFKAPNIVDLKNPNFVNPYGDAKFIVKVQVPMFGGLGNLAIYDQHRSVFNRGVDRDEDPESYDRLTRVCHAGILRLKIYLWAKLEGFNLRIYLGPDVPSQKQNW